MRLRVAIILTLLLGITAVASAQDILLEDQVEQLFVGSQPAAWFQAEDGTVRSIQLERIDSSAIPFGPLAGQGNQQCSDDLPGIGIEDTGATVVPESFLLYDTGDPILSCRWDFPDRGYRTVWYRLIADSTTQLVIDTYGSTYDTVLGVHTVGNPDLACSTLTEIACNDDFARFTSRVTFPVRAGETYYIQVGDYHAAYQGDEFGNDNTLYVTASSAGLTSRWEIVTNDPANPAAQRSRHLALAVDDKIYIISGQVSSGSGMFNTPSTVVYDTSIADPANAWHSLQAIPAGGGYGYAYTTAAYVNGKIYIPSGYIGVNGSYDGTHHVYDIAQNRWNAPAPSSNTWLEGIPSILATAVPYRWLNLDGYFLIGGLIGLIPDEDTFSFEARGDMYFYSTQNDLWFYVPAVLNRARFGHVAAKQFFNGDDQICVAGGFGKVETIGNLGKRELLASTECYDVGDGNWVSISSADLNFPRAYASSSVNSHGDWYIFGGSNGNGRAVSAVERFNRDTKKWEVLDVTYDLGSVNIHDQGQVSRPARLFPRGGFVGDTLWVFGGETVVEGIVNLIEKVSLPRSLDPGLGNKVFFPLTPFYEVAIIPDDDSYSTAIPLPLNQAVENRFYGENDFYEVLYFDVPSYRQVTIKVDELPLNSLYKFELFTDLKDARPPVSGNFGQSELSVARWLEAGRYYIILTREFPPPASDPSPPPYRVEVQG